MFNPIQITRGFKALVGTAEGNLFEHVFRRGDVCHVDDFCEETENSTFLILHDLGCVELPNDAWRWKKVTERDVCEYANELRNKEGFALKPQVVSLGLFARVWNDRRFDNVGTVMGFFGFDEGTIKKYRRRARRAGYHLMRMRRQQPLDVEGLNELIRN